MKITVTAVTIIAKYALTSSLRNTSLIFPIKIRKYKVKLIPNMKSAIETTYCANGVKYSILPGINPKPPVPAQPKAVSSAWKILSLE